MWIPIAAQLLTCLIALGLLWKDWGELKTKARHLPITIFLSTLVLTILSVVLAVRGEVQEAEHKGEVKGLETQLGKLLDQNRGLQQEISDTKQACQSLSKKPTINSTTKPAEKKPPDVSTVINAPGGIPIVGNQGTVNNPTVNNYGPLPRHLLDQTKNDLIECLRKKPGRFSIGAVANSVEAYKYADDWRSVFLSAGWEIEHKDIPIQIFMIGGGVWSGIQIRVHDASPTQGQIEVAKDTPEYDAAQCIFSVNGQIAGGGNIIPYKDFPTGAVRIDVGPQPSK